MSENCGMRTGGTTVSASDDRDNRWTWQGAAVEFRVPERSGRLEQTPLEARTRVMD
ncbi:hypothetical protein [Natrinema sp. H-ect4]|uniref:hypothetical protein n=1 Tax=Natrinema sp. H-ect4 TaxID=3242699 RepID=UPI0035A9149B